MKHGHFILSASIATALAGASVFSQPAQALSFAGNTSEAARVTQTVNNNNLSLIARTHLGFVERKAPVKTLADSVKMNHMQLILKPSAARQAALAGLIADQHNPKSSRFHQWLTPKQFGESYGVADSDIAAVTSWLKSQGFTVNNVYPNKTQIDFSGTSGQIKNAFHTQEGIYEVGQNKEQHLANSGDIQIPAALNGVVAGVMGLNDFHPKALRPKLKTAKWDAKKKSLVLNQPGVSAKTGGKSQAINVGYTGYNPQGQIRALVPNDMMTMYGIRDIRANGVTGKGITIAVVEDNNMIQSDWTNFTSVFNLQQYGGTFALTHPAPIAGTNNCLDPDTVNTPGTKYYDPDDGETLLDAEWSTAIAPGANIVVATCADASQANGVDPETTNFFGGVYLAADNLINAADGSRPNIISASYGYGEFFTDSPSKSAIDLMWAQADVEGISVFVSTGDSGSNPSFNGALINGYYGATGVDANSFATSPNVTGVGGTDLADIIDGTTSQYFASTPSAVGGTALSYVPEIPWNQSCGNGVAAKSLGYTRPVGFCNDAIRASFGTGTPGNPDVATYYSKVYETSEAGSGGPSSVDRKPVWQRQVFGAAKDQSRDLPDVSLFAGSFGDNTFVSVCSSLYVCTPDFTSPTSDAPNPANVGLSGGTSLASPMFAGIQALIDQGLSDRGLAANQGNAAPTLYALAADEYGGSASAGSSLATCNADNGATGTDGCVFHNVTRGSISSGCYSVTSTPGEGYYNFNTENCYFYNTTQGATDKDGNPVYLNFGLTTTDAAPTSYTPSNKAYSAHPGWSFAAGLGSVNTRNLLIAWRAFVGAPPMPPIAPKAVTLK
ncbi:S53 family peptidase [Rhodanobacter sp. BL-MT-08]